MVVQHPLGVKYWQLTSIVLKFWHEPHYAYLKQIDIYNMCGKYLAATRPVIKDMEMGQSGHSTPRKL